MPLYYFHLRAAQRVIPDFDGMELPNADAADSHARDVARDLLKRHELERRDWVVYVCDEAGNALSAVLFATVDSTLDHLEWRARELIESLAWRRATAKYLLAVSRWITARSRAASARASRKPHLIAQDGVAYLEDLPNLHPLMQADHFQGSEGAQPRMSPALAASPRNLVRVVSPAA
jgi:hypothetical protein